MDIKVNDVPINNIRYAYDTVILTYSADILPFLLSVIHKADENIGLDIII